MLLCISKDWKWVYHEILWIVQWHHSFKTSAIQDHLLMSPHNQYTLWYFDIISICYITSFIWDHFSQKHSAVLSDNFHRTYLTILSGLLIVICIGVALGVALGIVMLAGILLCLKRYSYFLIAHRSEKMWLYKCTNMILENDQPLHITKTLWHSHLSK